mgnify:CR=1 FL=1
MKPNILVLSIDSLRNDMCFGQNKTSFTPNLDSLISKGTFFTHAIACSSSTIPSFSSIFTGLYPFACVGKKDKIVRINENVETFVKQFKNFGYNCHTFIPEVLNQGGIDKIFPGNLEKFDSFSTLNDGVGDKIIGKLTKELEEPWMYTIHLFDLHGKVTLDRSGDFQKFNDEKFGKNNYEKVFSAMDEWIGKIISKINLENTLVIVTADHGSPAADFDDEKENESQKFIKSVKYEPGTVFKIGKKIAVKFPNLLKLQRKKISKLYVKKRDKIVDTKRKEKLESIQTKNLSPFEERILKNTVTTIPNVFEETCRVPLLFCGLNIPNGKIISQQIQTLDIFPTVAEIISMSLTNSLTHSRSLLTLINGKKIEEKPAYMETVTNTETDDVIGIRVSNFKYFRNSIDPKKNIHLYDLQNDPKEEENLYQNYPEKILEMEKIIDEIRKENLPKQLSELTDDEVNTVENELRKLGYI